MPAAFIPSTSSPDPLEGLREELIGHGFVVGNAIFAGGAGWSLGQSNAVGTLSTDMVAEVTDADNFRRAYDGESIVIPGKTFTAGSPIGDSATVAGDVEEFDSQSGSVPGAVASNVLGYAESAEEMTFRKERAVN